MKIGSILAIYTLFWVMSLFVVLPFGVRTSEEEGFERVPGQAESAPHRFSLPRAMVRATLVATPLFALYYANYVYGWVGVEALEWARPPRI